MKIPKHLKHKPLAIIDGRSFTELDGRYAKITDLQGISLGRAQWDNQTLSVKAWRHTGKRWSRMSEELPMSRVVDLMLLIAKVKSNINKLPEANILHVTNNEIEINFDELEKDPNGKAIFQEEWRYLHTKLVSLKDILNKIL